MKKRKQKVTKDKEKKDEDYYVSIGMCIGICIGTSIGVATDNIALWLPIGLCLGLSIGYAFSDTKKNK